MRICIDARPLQLDAYRERGIGTHLRSWVEAAQTLNTPYAFTLLYDPTLPTPRVKLTSQQWALQPMALRFGSSNNLPTELHMGTDEEFQFDSGLEAFLCEQKFDLFHATYTFMWEAFVARRLYQTRWVATFYDLIPLVFEQEYLDPLGARGRRSFAQRLGAAIYAQRAQTISSASRIDLVKNTGIDSSKVDVVYCGIDPSFRRISSDDSNRELSHLGIHGEYIFSVSGFHHTKNMRRLLEAYSLLPEADRRRHQLVVLCPLSPAIQETIHQWLELMGTRDNVVLLSHVSQAQLVALYNGAGLVAHPTLYEGFGLPIAEAMRCGTPVVASNTSSMPEVAGEAAILVDPKNPNDIAHGITRVLASHDMRAEMCEKGLRQTEQFTWENTAKAVLESYSTAIDQPLYSLERVFHTSHAETRPSPSYKSRNGRKLRLAFWSPLNPKPSGVSDYSELLISELGKYADVDVFLDGYQPSNLPLFDSYPMYDARAYPYLAEARGYDLDIYQLGNNPLHQYIYQWVLNKPGIITLHDVYLYHMIHAALMRDGHSEDFWREVEYCEGSVAAQQARVRYLTGNPGDYDYALNRRLVMTSRGVVVHSEWAKKRVARYEGSPQVRVIPFGILNLEDDGGRFGSVVRGTLNLPSDAYIFGVFGNLHPVKRLPVIVRVFERLRAQYPNATLFIMGPAVPGTTGEVLSLQSDPGAAKARGIHLHLTYASYDLMLMAMQAVDAGINLRFPTAGETSGTISMLLGQGKPTIVSDVGSFTEYPDDCCPKVPIGDQEDEILLKHMRDLMSPRKYHQAALAAWGFARDKTWSHCAQSYMEFVEQTLTSK